MGEREGYFSGRGLRLIEKTTREYRVMNLRKSSQIYKGQLDFDIRLVLENTNVVAYDSWTGSNNNTNRGNAVCDFLKSIIHIRMPRS